MRGVNFFFLKKGFFFFFLKILCFSQWQLKILLVNRKTTNFNFFNFFNFFFTYKFFFIKKINNNVFLKKLRTYKRYLKNTIYSFEYIGRHRIQNDLVVSKDFNNILVKFNRRYCKRLEFNFFSDLFINKKKKNFLIKKKKFFFFKAKINSKLFNNLNFFEVLLYNSWNFYTKSLFLSKCLTTTNMYFFFKWYYSLVNFFFFNILCINTFYVFTVYIYFNFSKILFNLKRFNVMFIKKSFFLSIYSLSNSNSNARIKYSLQNGKYRFMRFFFKKYFSFFTQHYFYKFVLLGAKYSNFKKFNFSFLSLLLFLPDAAFYTNFNGYLVTSNKYAYLHNNIMPSLFLNVRIASRHNRNFFNNNVFLWYLLNSCEKKFNKPFYFKILYSRFSLKKKIFKKLCVKIFKKFKRYNYKFKRNFFLGEIVRVLLISLYSRDATLFLNWFIWTLMNIPYKNVKKFLYFLKIILKKQILPKFRKFFKLRGFIFDIRGKVGVTGDSKKRHTLISWGQSSFSRKDLKLSLKQGLVFTRTGVMGVTVIIIF